MVLTTEIHSDRLGRASWETHKVNDDDEDEDDGDGDRRLVRGNGATRTPAPLSSLSSFVEPRFPERIIRRVQAISGWCGLRLVCFVDGVGFGGRISFGYLKHLR